MFHPLHLWGMKVNYVKQINPELVRSGEQMLPHVVILSLLILHCSTAHFFVNYVCFCLCRITSLSVFFHLLLTSACLSYLIYLYLGPLIILIFSKLLPYVWHLRCDYDNCCRRIWLPVVLWIGSYATPCRLVDKFYTKRHTVTSVHILHFFLGSPYL
jgi:hypothetical protein